MNKNTRSIEEIKRDIVKTVQRGDIRKENWDGCI